MNDTEELTPETLGLKRPAYRLSHAIRDGILPWGKTKTYEKINSGDLVVLKDGNQTIVTAPAIVKVYKKLMASRKVA